MPAPSLPAGTPPRALPTGATILIPLAALPALLLWCGTASAGEGEALWALLRGGGQVVVMRHASTDPGPGDPAGFRLDDCATQRNLSAAGRQEAQRIGALFRTRGVPIGQVLSSRWCRCLETARLAFGTVEPWPALDSFFNDRSRETAQTGALRERAGERPATGNLILVTHQVNITSLTGTFPAPGEIIVLSPEGNGAFRLAGCIAPPAPSPK